MSVLNQLFRSGLELIIGSTAFDIASTPLAVTLLTSAYVSPGLDATGITYNASTDAARVQTVNITSQSWTWDANTRSLLLVPSAAPFWSPASSQTFRYGVLHAQDNAHAPFAQLSWPADQTVQGTTFTDGVTNTDTSLTSATAAFVSTDVGLGITELVFPQGATIASVTNGTTVVLSAATTATATGVTITIARVHALSLDALLRLRMWTDLSPTPLGSVYYPIVIADTSGANWRLVALTGALATMATSEVDLTHAFLTSPDSTLWMLQVNTSGAVSAVNTGTFTSGDRLYSTSNPCLLPSADPTVQYVLSVSDTGALSVA